ncbi:hypothetical protein AGLY_016986 [Aphis glycines]|uniref:RNA-directed RNA polymerase n=1 Tax=Aphis glycines TaxID=307491 RepID=A0A6G0SW81_APHGL|nr:hypothetical protein AGLY_016986 [Aphis glycines]
MDITAIQEVRWTSSGSLKSQGMTLFYSGEDKHERGVGFIIKDNLLPQITNFKPINDRLCYVELKCKWHNLILINCYSPTEDKNEEIKNEFFDNLDMLYDSLPADKPKIVIGDFNAKIGKETIYKPTIGSESLHEESNDNGYRLISFAAARNMTISSTCFPHKNIHKQTWISPCGYVRNQIDHIVVDSRIKSCIRDVRSMRGSSAMSDHFLVRAKINIRISTEWRKKQKHKGKIDRDALKTSTAKVYQEKLMSKIQNIQERPNISEIWKEVEQIVKTTAEEVLEYIPEKTRKMWFNEECKRVLHEKDRARMKVLHEPNEDNKRLLALKQREVKKVIRSNKRLWEKERIQNIENNRNSHSKIFFRKANEVRHGYKPRPNVLRKSDGTLLTGNKEIACEFKDMFANLLNQPIINITVNELTTVEQLLVAPSKNELEMGLNMLKNGKAPGVDEIVSECLKKGGPCLLNQLHKLINIIWEQEEIPESWRVSILCPVFKKGDIMECENYRGISLLNTTYKILSNILLIRINPYIKEIIGEYQAGFMIGRSTVDQIHIIKQLAEKSHEFNKDIHLMFIDYKAAYDSINREKLWNVMNKMGIPAKLVRMIRACAYESKSKVSFGGEVSDEFPVTTGLRQGDALSPALFNIALESVIRKVLIQAKGIKMNNNNELTVVAYADDIVLIAESEDDLRNTTSILLNEGKEIGLKINESKTKYMILSRRNHNISYLKVDDYKFERVQSFKYLGTEINESANSHEEVKKRITAANRCYYSLMPLFKSRLLSINSKITLYKVIVKPVALYACSTWATTKSDEGKLGVFERKILRKIFGPKRNNDGEYEVRGNRELYDLYKEPTIVGSLKSTRISWAGHVWRSEGMIGSITNWKPDTKRPRGRPRQRWVDRVKEDLKLLNVRNAEECANDREEWKQYVVAAMGLKGL